MLNVYFTIHCGMIDCCLKKEMQHFFNLDQQGCHKRATHFFTTCTCMMNVTLGFFHRKTKGK